MGRFQVLFSGDVAEGATETVVRQNLVRRLGLDERKVAQLFSGRTVVIRSDLTREAADELQAELAGLGAIARIKDISPDEKAKFRIDKHVDQTLKDITAAHHECPRCGHLQLESEFCARCGVDIASAMKQKRKEDVLIEKKIKGLKVGQKPGIAEQPDSAIRPDEAAALIQPIKRRIPRPAPPPRAAHPVTTAPRSASMRPRKDPVRREPPAGPHANPFGGGFWRNVLKLGRKDERS
jgi:ribosomal protein S27AE